MLILATNETRGKSRSVKAPRKLGTYYQLSLYGFRIRICGETTKAYTLSDIANIFGLHRSTVYRWYHEEWLPPPAIRRIRRYRGNSMESPLYIHEQVLLIRRALNCAGANLHKQFNPSSAAIYAWMHHNSYWVCKNFYADSPLPDYFRPESEEF